MVDVHAKKIRMGILMQTAYFLMSGLVVAFAKNINGDDTMTIDQSPSRSHAVWI